MLREAARATRLIHAIAGRISVRDAPVASCTANARMKRSRSAIGRMLWIWRTRPMTLPHLVHDDHPSDILCATFLAKKKSPFAPPRI